MDIWTALRKRDQKVPGGYTDGEIMPIGMRVFGRYGAGRGGKHWFAGKITGNRVVPGPTIHHKKVFFYDIRCDDGDVHTLHTSCDTGVCTANNCNARTAADWLTDGCEFSNPTATTVFGLGSHNRVTPTTSCEVTCPVYGGDFVVTSATGVCGCGWMYQTGPRLNITTTAYPRLPLRSHGHQ